jgi:small subunit ribosomal protein S6
MKIPKDTQSRSYELTYLIPDSLTETERQVVDEEVEGLIKKVKAEIKETQDWGKKRLAYKIRHRNKYYTQAYYSHRVIVLKDPEKAPELDREIQLHTQVMRHLLVKSEITAKG